MVHILNTNKYKIQQQSNLYPPGKPDTCPHQTKKGSATTDSTVNSVNSHHLIHEHAYHSCDNFSIKYGIGLLTESKNS